MVHVFFKNVRRNLLIVILSVFMVNLWSFEIHGNPQENDEKIPETGVWHGNNRQLSIVSIYKNSQYLTIQDSNPVNTITVKITSNETGTTVFENVYPQGQTSFIVIPMDGWSAGSYTIELFGRENNGYLWGTFQVLP